MNSTYPVLLVGLSLGLTIASTISCSDRHADEQCYFDDSEDADKYSTGPMAWRDWCDYRPHDISPLIDEHCPAGNCVDTFITCKGVPRDQACQTCPAEELDHDVLVALGARYAERCPDSPHELIDFERGCMYEQELIPASAGSRHCCYTAVIVGECSLMGT